MRNILIIGILSLLSGIVSAHDFLIPVQTSSKWGYCDDMGQIVINPTYGAAFPFFNDHALVYKTIDEHAGYWCMVNEQGNELSDFTPIQNYSGVHHATIHDTNGWVKLSCFDEDHKLYCVYIHLLTAEVQKTKPDDELVDLSTPVINQQNGRNIFASNQSDVVLINEKGKIENQGMLVKGGIFYIEGKNGSVDLNKSVLPVSGFVHNYALVYINPEWEKVAQYSIPQSDEKNFIDQTGNFVFNEHVRYAREFEHGYVFAGDLSDSLYMFDHDFRLIQTFHASKVDDFDSSGILLVYHRGQKNLSVYDITQSGEIIHFSSSAYYHQIAHVDDHYIYISSSNGIHVVKRDTHEVISFENKNFVHAFQEILVYEIDSRKVIVNILNNEVLMSDLGYCQIIPEFKVFLWNGSNASGIHNFKGEPVFNNSCTCIQVLPNGFVYLKNEHGDFSWGHLSTGKIY